ncbi:MAG: hypothetical protein PHT33_14115 [bacterium]|nr:hypothetical protein [bacterium]
MKNVLTDNATSPLVTGGRSMKLLTTLPTDVETAEAAIENVLPYVTNRMKG